MSDSKDENALNKATSRRSMLKWTGALAATAVVGIGLGVGADLLLRPNSTKTTTQTQVNTTTQTNTATQTVQTTVTPPATTITQQAKTTPAWVEASKFAHAGLSGPFYVYVQDGVISRIEEFDRTTTHLATFDRAWRNRVYAADRIQYPMKRVDFSSSGSRNPQNRGISGYVRISWDEATTTVANELTRAKDMYSNSSIFTMRDTGWNSTGAIYPLDVLLNLFGGYTQPVGFYSDYGLQIGETYSIGYTSETGAAGSTSWQAVLDNTKYTLCCGDQISSLPLTLPHLEPTFPACTCRSRQRESNSSLWIHS